MYVLMYVDYKFFLICSIVLCFAFVGGNSMKRCGVTLNWYVMFEMKLLIWYVMSTWIFNGHWQIVLCFTVLDGLSMNRCAMMLIWYVMFEMKLLNWYVTFEMKLLIWYAMVTGCKDLRVSLSQVRCWGWKMLCYASQDVRILGFLYLKWDVGDERWCVMLHRM